MKNLTPLKAIRAKCMECCYDQFNEIRLCPSVDCPLHPYRMGHRPSYPRKVCPLDGDAEI